ncbi:MAG: hypothetical protein ACD_20C00358G0008 [uncultured bacterium]|nr:MAG: hypothetical protein ACD_20C00358G0008 [uncultured bacterium]HBH19296.1 hypothetical protein [Cyanobacteria bacterium UBA9579]
MKHKTKVKLGLFTIILAVLLSGIQFFLFNFKLLKNEIRLYPDYPDKNEFSKYEQQFSAVKKALPPYGSIGYITDDKIRAFNKDSDYFIAQYLLAPLIVLNSADQEYVISKFYYPIKPEIYKKYKLVKDFGDGIILFKRVDS